MERRPCAQVQTKGPWGHQGHGGGPPEFWSQARLLRPEAWGGRQAGAWGGGLCPEDTVSMQSQRKPVKGSQVGFPRRDRGWPQMW